MTNRRNDDSTQCPQSFKEYIDREIAQADRRYEERFVLSQRALDAALAANNMRLEEMDDFRDAMDDQAGRYIQRSEVDTALKAGELRLDHIIGPIQEKLAAQGKTNWPLMIGFVGVLASVLGGCWLLIGLQITVAEGPLGIALENVKNTVTVQASAQIELASRLRTLEQDTAKSQSADNESRTDRLRLNDRLHSLESDISTGRSERVANETKIKSEITEIETQFKSVGNMISVGNDRANQWLALLWEKVFPNTKFPRQGFIPQPARHDPAVNAE